MKLVSFTVEKYRSITKAHRIGLDNTTILVGPNNEGKSNILRALVAAMNILTRGRGDDIRGARKLHGFYTRNFYNWELDYPIHLQKANPKGESIMILEFELSKEEIDEFKREVKSKLNGTLPIRIAISSTNIDISVNKKGRGAKTLSLKSSKIAFFVSSRLDFEHIPAVRTAEAAQDIVNEMVGKELQKLEIHPDYIDSLKKIGELQQPLLDSISSSIKTTLKQFLPNVKDVKLQIRSEDRYRALRRSCEIYIDDGTSTLLQYKGDGVQSLSALGLMRHASESGARGRNLVIAIEEPESHLHPKAIHSLKNVINELSQKYQIVLTTHCPLFVDRVIVNSNIIVNNKRAKPAKNIEEIRKILGVKASDNLRNAELVLIVEGEDDRTSLIALLKHFSDILRESLNNNTLVVDSLAGATNLSYKITQLRDTLCVCHSFLDNDKAGKSAYEKAENEGLINLSEVNFANVVGLNESEFEDTYDITLYQDMIRNKYGVLINTPKFNSNKKWSERMRDIFKLQGKDWNDKIEKEVKNDVSELVSAKPDIAININKKDSFDNLVISLENRLKEIREMNVVSG